MSKLRKRKPSHAYKGCPDGTRELTGLERQMQLANEWYMRLDEDERHDIAQSAGSADISGAMLAAYRERDDAGRPG